MGTTNDAARGGAVAGHTPGPWEIRVDTDDGRAQRIMGGESGYDPVAFPAWGSVPADVTNANARLIAAAPTMLAALEAVQRLDYFREHNALARQVDEAIRAARAEG